MTDDQALEMGDTEKRERLLPEYRDDLMGVPLLLLDSARRFNKTARPQLLFRTRKVCNRPLRLLV